MRPTREGNRLCLLCWLTHTFTGLWDKKFYHLNSTLSRLFFTVCPARLPLQKVLRTWYVARKAFWLEARVYCSDCVSCYSLLILNKLLSKETEPTQWLQVTAYSVSADWFNPSDCWVLQSTVTQRWVGCKLQRYKNAFGCWRGKLPQSEAANLPTHCRELLTSTNLSSLLRTHDTKTERLVSSLEARRCLRINGVVEDSRQGVVDVADHVIQLVLCL